VRARKRAGRGLEDARAEDGGIFFCTAHAGEKAARTGYTARAPRQPTGQPDRIKNLHPDKPPGKQGHSTSTGQPFPLFEFKKLNPAFWAKEDCIGKN